MAKSDRAQAALRNPSYLRVANIIRIKNLNSDNDVDAIEDYLAKNGDPYENALKDAQQAVTDIQKKSVQDLQNLTKGFNTRIAEMNQAFDRRYGNLQSQANDRYNSLNNVLISRTRDFNKQLDQAAAQNAELQGLYSDSQRMAANQANAYVPDANPGAQSAAAGDDRANLLSTAAKKKTNELNNLSILSGLGTQANPLAGLQIA